MRMLFLLLAAAVVPFGAAAQTVCAPTPAYSPCEISFELNEQEAAAHPNPYLTVDLEVEFRSPRFRTLRLPAFWDGGRRMTVRFTPTDDGEWVFRATSNVPRLEGLEGKVTATESGSPGFVRPANTHHWAYVDDSKNQRKTPHLWMGDTLYTFPLIERAVFDKVIDARAAQKFNHVRGVILSRDHKMFSAPDRPDPTAFRELDARILYMNGKGIVADLVLAWDRNHLAEAFPSRELRDRYIRYVVARYAGMHITWQGVQEFEEYENGRTLLKEIGELLK
ncbi:MAG TPA: DUF5060 domain-containing protein, partial [Bryobacteraceae bacterium]|nr:DUF5060 domain-containing protein [Bryobacteraceae bacterium]